jgi:hypothetical protein
MAAQSIRFDSKKKEKKIQSSVCVEVDIPWRNFTGDNYTRIKSR